MKSICIRNKCTAEKEYPYFVECGDNIWLVTGKCDERKGFHKQDRNAMFVTGNRNYRPFEYVGSIRMDGSYKVIDRCQLRLMIGEK